MGKSPKYPLDFSQTDTGPNPYRVPEGYFDSLSERIMDRVKSAPGESLLIQLLPAIRWSVAALIAGALLISRLIHPTLVAPSISTSITAEEISASTLWEDLDESLLMDHTVELSSINSTELDSESISDFLLENSIDISQIEIDI